MQEETAAVATAQRIKSTAEQVAASRRKYQAKSDAADQLRRRRPESAQAKTLLSGKAQQVCFLG